MKILTFTTLYPNLIKPRHGVFVEQRLRHLLNLEGIESKVVAPIPWFPIKAKIFRRYSDFVQIPKKETRYGIEVLHPRYLTIPKIGMTAAPLLLYQSTLGYLRKIIYDGFNFDLIDAHYFYPDGVAATLLGKTLNKPVVITARGSDINLISKYRLPRLFIKWSAMQSSAVVAVCSALRNQMLNIGIDAEKTHVFRNGVDLYTFAPMDREEIRKRHHLLRPTLLSVGNLIELKGHHLIIKALRKFTHHELLIVGDGPDAKKLVQLSKDIGVSERTRFLGTLTHEELAEIYNAADILILASRSEGWANVLLESMACGTPVVATDVGGTPEILTRPEAGVLIQERSVSSIERGIEKILMKPPVRSNTRQYAERFSWEQTSELQYSLFSRICTN